MELSAQGQTAARAANGEPLSREEQEQVRKLKDRDREVRAHEQAHQRVGGQYAGAPSYEFQTGPDGKQYAVGGEVAIDASPVRGDPEATIEKMRIVKAAALAPAEPSGQDRKVAAQADATAQQARAEKAEMDRAEREAEQAARTGEADPLTPGGPQSQAADPGVGDGGSIEEGAGPGSDAPGAASRPASGPQGLAPAATVGPDASVAAAAITQAAGAYQAVLAAQAGAGRLAISA